MTDPIVVVGSGPTGGSGLSPSARRAIDDADVVMGSGRDSPCFPDSPALRVAWPSPLDSGTTRPVRALPRPRVCVLASGDPMFYGIGVTLVRLLGPEAVRVLPQPSSASLACARLGWALAETPVVSVVGRPLATILPELTDGRRTTRAQRG